MVALRRGVTLLAVIVGWVLFRAPTFGTAAAMLDAMFRPRAFGFDDGVILTLTPLAVTVMVCAMIVFVLPTRFSGYRLVTGSGLPAGLARGALLFVVFPWSLILVQSGTFSPFLYFRF